MNQVGFLYELHKTNIQVENIREKERDFDFSYHYDA